LGDGYRERATGFATGTTVLALPRDAVLEFRFAEPPRDLLNSFTSLALSSLHKQWNSQNQSNTLAALRDALLPKLISGKLRVKDADRCIKETTL
jgi:type I restriction enzyme S subunit